MVRELKKGLDIAQVPRTANNSIINYLTLLSNYLHLHLARADTGLGSNFAFKDVVISTVALTNLQLVSH